MAGYLETHGRICNFLSDQMDGISGEYILTA